MIYNQTLLDKAPDLCKEWSDKNPIEPSKVSPRSNKKYLWNCSKCDYEWSMSPDKRIIGRGCPACANKVVTDKNRLSIKFPNIAKEWDYTQNTDIPENVSYGSNKKFWWKCSKCNYSWESTVINRTSGWSCPACSGKIVTDKNRMTILYPGLVSEWDFNKNKKDILEISYSSNIKYWWICNKCNHSWFSSPNTRTGQNQGCPKCKYSHGEKEIEKFLIEHNIKYENQYKIPECKNIKTLPFDFAIWMNNKLGLIEYNGEQHYEKIWKNRGSLEQNIYRDKIKENYCKENNIPLLIIPYWEYKNISTILETYIIGLKNEI